MSAMAQPGESSTFAEHVSCQKLLQDSLCTLVVSYTQQAAEPIGVQDSVLSNETLRQYSVGILRCREALASSIA